MKESNFTLTSALRALEHDDYHSFPYEPSNTCVITQLTPKLFNI